MPRIKTSKGFVKYKTQPIYLGIKKIDKDKAAYNLKLLKEILDKQHIQFELFFGTLLGIVRDNDFIDYDEDIDLAFLEEDRERFLYCLPKLIEAGFSIARYDRRGVLSIIRDGEYIDLYFFKEYNDKMWSCSGWLDLKEFLFERTTISFRGQNYFIPKDAEGFLLSEYGKNWRIPIKWNNYEMPRWKINLLKFKIWIKDILPDIIYFAITNLMEKRISKKCLIRLNQYLIEKESNTL